MSDIALASRLSELEADVAGEKVVTRHILEQLRANTDVLLQVQREVTYLRTELIGEIGNLRKEMIGEIGGLRQKVTGDIGAVRHEVVGEIGSLRHEVISLHQKVDKLADRVALQEAHLLSFEAKFPRIAADAPREALRGRGD